jgi:LacI family transcriptional regulator
MPLTLEDIARMAGASRSTVSRVLNDDPNVKESTRQKIWEIVHSVNFQPNVAARGLAAGRIQVLGLVIPMAVTSVFADPYFPLLIQWISSACNQRNYSMMLWLVEPVYELRVAHEILYGGLTGGVIIASNVLDDPIVMALIESQKMPFIMIGRHPADPRVSYVDVDNRVGAALAVEHLIHQGRKRIATITGPQTMIAGMDRYYGYLDGLARHQRQPDPFLVAEADFSEEGGYQAMLKLIPYQPDALFSASDMMSIGAMRAIKEAGMKIPEQIAMVSFDDIPAAARTNPPLTTMRQPIQRTGAMAAELLIDMIENASTEPRRVVLTTELVVRSTCGTSL